MVSQRENQTKTCPSLTLEAYVPKNNFYRRLKQILDLSLVYEAVKPFYGKCGQKSIDPVVFFKLLLVGHFENICSDRNLIASCQLRLDILYFLDYKLGERLPGPEIRFHLRSAIVQSPEQESDCLYPYLRVCLKK